MHGSTGDARRPWSWRATAVRAGVAGIVLAALFGFVLPRLADYAEVWETVGGLSTGAAGLLVVVGLWNLVTYWPVMMLAQPGLRLREAVVVNQASTAVANTVPGGAAVAIGVTYRMLRAWGFTVESISNLVVVTGVWNQLVKLGMPVVAIAAVAATGDIDGSAMALAVWGVGGLGVVLLAGWSILRAEDLTRRFGRRLDALATRLPRRVRHRGDSTIESRLTTGRSQLVQLLRRTAGPLTLATVVSHLSLYLVLLTALRAVGISGDEVGWDDTLVAFSLVRLLSAIPVTPGGVGFVELGYVGLLATAAGGMEDQITAAVLVFRAITFVFPIVIGAVAALVFRQARDWRQPPDTRGTRLLEPAPQGQS